MQLLLVEEAREGGVAVVLLMVWKWKEGQRLGGVESGGGGKRGQSRRVLRGNDVPLPQILWCVHICACKYMCTYGCDCVCVRVCVCVCL